MQESRIKNTKRNIFTSFVYTFLTILFQFISRSVIVYYLGEKYLGLSSLFTSILQVLNMAELGFSGAIVYNMYKPLAEDDTESVCALLAYYKKVYRTVGIIVLVAGVIIMPFIHYLIKGSYPSNINIYSLFALYLANTVVSYFLFAYKTSLLEAVQRMDLAKLAYIIVTTIQYILQILALAFFKNYYLFVVFMVLGSASRNIVAAVLAKKFFPQYECRGNVSHEVTKNIISRVRGLLICNVSSVTQTTVDSIILSALIGLSSVAIYNNYITVMTGVSTFVKLVRNAMQASIGNSVAKEAVKKNYNDMLLWQFMFSLIASWCASCMLSLYQPFMELWMGKNMLLSMKEVVMICLWFNIGVIQHSYYLYLSANGLWWQLRGPYIGSTLFNLTFNIILGRIYGISGIIFASLLSSLLFGLIWQCNVIFREYFKQSTQQFYKRQVAYFLVSVFSGAVSWSLCALITVDGYGGLILKFVVCSITSATILLLCYFKTDMFKKAVAFTKNAIHA